MEIEEIFNTGRRIAVAKKKAQKFEFERKRGKLIDSRDCQWILRTFYVLKSKQIYVNEDEEVLIQLVSEIACCSIDSIRKILENDSYEIEDQRGQNLTKRKIQMEEEEEIKNNVVQLLKNDLDKGSPVCTRDVRAWIRDSASINLSTKTLLNYLRNWGISWRRLKVDEYRKAREEVILLKTQFLQIMNDELTDCTHVRSCKCSPKKKLVFLDESYLHEHHVSQFGLGLDDYPLSKPSGKGKRIVIAGAITEDGWLGANQEMRNWGPNMENVYENGSIRCWVANIGGDYHNNFNIPNFLNYFEECILNNLTEPSIIVLDRARYHTAIPDDSFSPYKARKEELRTWLNDNKIRFDQSTLKDDLKTLVLCHWEPPQTIIEDMAQKHGLEYFGSPHRVIFLPPYHPEYNGIEMAWGQVKHYVGMNPEYKIKALIGETLPKA